jgi:hypothetical protein
MTRWWRDTAMLLRCKLRLCNDMMIYKQQVIEVCEKKNKAPETIYQTVKQCKQCGRRIVLYSWER